jgi:hypothetical protein
MIRVVASVKSFIYFDRTMIAVSLSSGTKVMKTAALLLLSLWMFTTSFSQPRLPGDSLSRYSYLVMRPPTEQSPDSHAGTCFFISYNNNLFLVTAKHNFYDCDSLTNIKKRGSRIGVVFFPDPLRVVEFSIPEISYPCVNMAKDTDILVLSVDKSKFQGVRTIEQFIIPPVRNLGEVEIFGQGFQNDSISLRIDNPHRISMPRNEFRLKNGIYMEDGYLDSIHYVIEPKKKLVGRWMKGFSGSPAFLRDYKSKRWRFIGVFTGGYMADGVNGLMLIAKAEVLEKALRQ